jgi:hypothetical protein
MGSQLLRVGSNEHIAVLSFQWGTSAFLSASEGSVGNPETLLPKLVQGIGEALRRLRPTSERRHEVALAAAALAKAPSACVEPGSDYGCAT